MKIGGNQILVNPVRTNQMTNGTISTPNFMGNAGIETNFAKMIEENAYKYQELRDNEQFLGSESFTLEGTQDLQSFQLGLKTDDSFYKSPDKFNELSKRFKDRKEQYLKMAKDNGYKNEIIDAAISKMDREFAETQAIYGKYSLDYSKEKERQNEYLIADERAKTMSQIYLNGNISQGNASYKENGQAIWGMYKKDQLSVEQAVSRMDNVKQSAIISRVMAFVNVPYGEELLNRMTTYGFKEFQTAFQELEQKFGDYEVILSEDDFNTFKRTVGSGLSAINTKNNAKTQNNLYEELQARNDMYEKPLKYVLSKYEAGTQKNLYSDQMLTETTNIKYGTGYSNLEEHILAGNHILSVDKTTSLAPLYENASGPEIMEMRAKEVDEWAAGKSAMIWNAVADGEYFEMAGKVMGGVGIEKYRIDYTFQSNYNWLYNAENIKLQKMLPDIDTSPTTYMESMKTAYGWEINEAGPIVGLGTNLAGTTKEEITQVFNDKKFLEALQQGAIFGDPAMERMWADISGQYNDLVKTAIMHKTGGVLTKDLADELEIDTYNVTIESLQPEQKKKLVAYYMENSNGLFKGKEFELAKNKFMETVRIWGSDYQTVDLGTAGTIITDKSRSGQDIQDAVSYVLDRKVDYYLKDGKHKVSRRDIKIETRLGSNVFMPTFESEPLYDENGKQYVFKFDDVLKEIDK